MPGRFETLLMRAFDGEATHAEREELAAQAESEPRLADLAELRAALLEALSVAGPVDVAGDVMEALDESEWAPLGEALRDAMDVPVDIWAAVKAATSRSDAAEMELSAWADGELDAEPDVAALATVAEWAEVGEALRAAVRVRVDVWPGVERAVASADVEGWEPIAADIRTAFEGVPSVDVADAVMAAVRPARKVSGMPRWASLAMPLAVFAAAAALLFAFRPAAVMEPVVEEAAFALAAVNDVQIEDLTTGEDVVVQVMQFDDGGPTFIMIDEAHL